MQAVYSRPHRNSINEPATAHDLPFETLNECLLHLLKKRGSDLLFASLVCRAWRAVALELMHSCKRFLDVNKRIENFICGLQLRSLVGLKRVLIKNLEIDMQSVEKKYISLLVPLVGPFLSSLDLGFGGEDSTDCYEVLDVFFESCGGIRNLRLISFDFGDDPSLIYKPIKDGMSRLRQLDFLECVGDIRMFVENTPIANLQYLTYESGLDGSEEYEIVSALTWSYRNMKSIDLFANFESSASFLKIAEYCRDIENIKFADKGEELLLERSDILAISSLHQLSSLKIYRCKMADEAASALAKCRGLKDLRMFRLADPSVMSAIGRNLV
jgi:hypothetical protein